LDPYFALDQTEKKRGKKSEDFIREESNNGRKATFCKRHPQQKKGLKNREL